MRKLLVLIVLALLGFYGAWPAWSGWRISTAIKERDKALLASKVDFPSVREALKPVVTAELERLLEQRLKQDAGPLGGLIAGQFKGGQLAAIAESAINSVVTPETVIGIVEQGGTLKEAMERVLGEQIGRGLTRPGPGRSAGPLPPGSPGQPSAPTEPVKPAAGKPPLGIANIKRFAVDGPLSFTVGIARNAAASEPDLMATMAFSGGDWKVVRIVPRF